MNCLTDTILLLHTEMRVTVNVDAALPLANTVLINSCPGPNSQIAAFPGRNSILIPNIENRRIVVYCAGIHFSSTTNTKFSFISLIVSRGEAFLCWQFDYKNKQPNNHSVAYFVQDAVFSSLAAPFAITGNRPFLLQSTCTFLHFHAHCGTLAGQFGVQDDEIPTPVSLYYVMFVHYVDWTGRNIADILAGSIIGN